MCVGIGFCAFGILHAMGLSGLTSILVATVIFLLWDRLSESENCL